VRTTSANSVRTTRELRANYARAAYANSYEQRANYERELTRELRDAPLCQGLVDNQYYAVGLSSPLSKSSFIYLFLVFLHPKSSIGLKPLVRFFECVFFIYQQPQT
jgi:hypothetical protein